MKHLACWAGALAALLSTGCTSLEVARLNGGQASSGAAPPKGLAYYLPAKRFQIGLSYLIEDCELVKGQVRVVPQATVEVRGQQVSDDAERYVISYEDLASITKTTDLTIGLTEAGTLASMNAKVSDQTASVLTSAVSSIAAVGRAVALPGPAALWTWDKRRFSLMQGGEKTLSKPVPRCGDKDLTAKVDALEEARNDVKAIRQLQLDYADLEAARRKAGVDVELVKAELAEAQAAKDPVRIDKATQGLQKAKAVLAVARQELDDVEKPDGTQALANLSAAEGLLRISKIWIWTPGMNATSLTLAFSAADMSLLTSNEETARRIATDLSAQATLKFASHSSGNQEFKPADGLVYRMPAFVQMLICRGVCQNEAPGVSAFASDKFLYEEVHAVPQLGAKVSLPLKNRVFEDNTLNLAFGDSGQLKTLTFNSKASAERAASAVQTSADKYLEFVKGRNEDALTLRSALRDDATAQLDLEQAQRAASTATLKDRVEALNALKDIEEARSGTASTAAREQAALAARKQRLETLVEIKRLEKALGEP